MRTTTIVAAAGSEALRPLLAGPPAAGRVLGTSSFAVWAGVGATVVVVTGPGAVRLPNALALPADTLLPATAHDAAVTAGRNRLTVGDTEVRVVRWWDPRPRIHPVPAAELAARIERLDAVVPAVPDAGLGAALRATEDDRVSLSVGHVVGRGAGLTPEGDDLLVGVLAGVRLAEDPAPRRRLAVAVLALAPPRTTSLSLALLRHAVAGEFAIPVGRLLLALAGRGALADAADAVLAIGHSSGAALARGVLIGASAGSTR